MNTNVFLANVIWLFHVGVVLFVMLAPFFNVPSALVLHVTFCITLLVHWNANSNVCSLSVLESKLRGIDYTQSFTHQFIGPVYDVSSTDWSNIVWTATVVLMCVSAYRLYHSEVWGQVQACLAKSWSEKADKSTGQLLRQLVLCLEPLFRS